MKKLTNESNLVNTQQQKKPHVAKDVAEKQPKETKLALIEKFETINLAFRHDKLSLLNNIVDSPRLEYAVYEVENGMRVLLLKHPDGICERVPIEHLINEMLFYTRTYLRTSEFSHLKLTHAEAVQCAKYFIGAFSPTDVIKLSSIKAFRFRSEIGLCFARLPFDPAPNPGGAFTPTWNEFFSRMENATAVRCWIGSLFYPESYRQQYLWIYGKGSDGKGSLARFLMKIFGVSATTQSRAPNEFTNKHWACSYENKRLVIFPDFDDYKSINSGALKSVTGGDLVYVDPKGKQGYDVELTCKLLFLSNQMPNIPDDQAAMRRIIFSCVESFKGAYDPRYEDKLMEEATFFIHDCLSLYNDLYSTHGMINVTDKSKEQLKWIAEDDEFQMFFDEFFEIDEHSLTSPSQVQTIFVRRWPNDRQKYIEFKKWLLKTYDLRSVATRDKRILEKVFKAIKGLKIKN